MDHGTEKVRVPEGWLIRVGSTGESAENAVTYNTMKALQP